VCERPLIGSTSACACVQTGRGGGAVARTSLPAPLHHRSERLERLVSATVLPPSTLCSTIRYTVCVHYKPITENSNCTLLLRYCTVCTRYSYPWVRGALSTESRISVKRRSIQDCPGLGPLCYGEGTRYARRAHTGSLSVGKVPGFRNHSNHRPRAILHWNSEIGNQIPVSNQSVSDHQSFSIRSISKW